MRKPSSLLLAPVLLLAACRGGGGDDPDAPPASDGPPNPNDASIYDIQNPDNRVPPGTTVNVRGVVVTAVDRYGMRTGNFWVQEPAGGAFSGVLVFGADPVVVDTLQPGDIVDIEGAAKSEFSLDSDLSGLKTTELEPGDSGAILVTRVSSGTPLEPEEVDALAIARMNDTGTVPTARDNEWEKWEGVLIRIQDVTQMSPIEMIGMTDPTFEGFSVNGFLEIDTSLAAFPSGIDGDICIESVTGIGDYFFNHKVLPRTTAELVLNGTGCPAPEEGPAMCSDTMDNDSDGFTDCADFSCQSTDPACITTTSISAVQMGTVTGAVELPNVFVTGVTFNRSNLFVQDALAAAPYNGVFVFRGGSTVPDLPPEIVVGATVTVTGTVTEFMGITEITDPVVTFVAAPTGLPTPIATTIADLNNPTTGEPLEGVYVRLSDVSASDIVSMGGSSGLDYYYTLNQGTDQIIVDDDIYRNTPLNGDCYSTFSALFHYNNFTTPVPPHINLLPTAATDLVPGTNCN
jgi:hypothetical protein